MHLRDRRVKAKELGQIISINLNGSENEFTFLKPHGKGKGGWKLQDLAEKFVLEEWAILPCSHYCGLYLEGHRKGDPASVSWMTSMVEKRLDSHRLITVSGQCYQLVGDMIDEEFESALSSEFLTAFQKGFPRNWKNLLQEEGQKHKGTVTNGPVADILENVDSFNTHSCEPSFNIRIVTQPPIQKKAVSRRTVTKSSPKNKKQAQENEAKTDNSKTQTKKLTKPVQKTLNSAESKRSSPIINRQKSTPTPTTDTTRKQNVDSSKASEKKVNTSKANENKLTSKTAQQKRRRSSTSKANICDMNDVSNANETSNNSKNKRRRIQTEQSSAQGNKSTNQKSLTKISRKSPRTKSRPVSVLKPIQVNTLPTKDNAKDSDNDKNTPPIQDENQSKPWTKKEINSLQKVMKNLDRNSSGFWSEVVEKMGARTEEECRKCYQLEEEKQKEKPTKKTKENTANQAKQTVEITANKGTIKRKKQLKEYMENFNVGYEDEYFDSTPFKAKKSLKIPKLGMDNSFRMIADELGGWKSPGMSYVSTPGLKYSGMPTPQGHDQSAITPRIGDTDRYVHKILKQRKGRRITKKPLVYKEPLQEISENPIPESLGGLFEKKTANPENDVDSDEEFDDYFTEG